MPSLGKKLMFDELVTALGSNSYVFFSRYQGLSVGELSELRRKLEKVSHRALVVKNSIARRAFEKIGIKEVNGFIKGSVLLALGAKEPQLISKVLIDFGKGRNGFELTGACLDGELYDASYLKRIASLPSREVLLAQMVRGLNVPIGEFVYVMNQLICSLAVALDQVCRKKAD